jgi:hypothetical protein
LDPFAGFVAAVLADWRESDLANVLGVAPGAAAPPGRAEFSILSRRQAKADMSARMRSCCASQERRWWRHRPSQQSETG